MKKNNLKTLAADFLSDIIGCLLISVGVYNFAVASEFPITGVSGIALVFHHYWEFPIGLTTMVLNIPIIIVCGRILGIRFVLRSLRTMFISTILMDTVVPRLPVYQGELILSCICMGIFSGVGYAFLYMRGTSTGGVDFITMSIKAKKPHLSLGRIIVVIDCSILIVTGLLMGGNVDKIIYGLIGSTIVSVVVDKVMYGIDAGKVTLIVTTKGKNVSEKIYELTGRGATLLRGGGSFSGEEKQVVMCACSNKQMHVVQKVVKEVDVEAFMVIMESNEVRGKGFKPH